MAATIIAIGVVCIHAFIAAVLWVEFRSRERRIMVALDQLRHDLGLAPLAPVDGGAPGDRPTALLPAEPERQRAAIPPPRPVDDPPDTGPSESAMRGPEERSEEISRPGVSTWPSAPGAGPAPGLVCHVEREDGSPLSEREVVEADPVVRRWREYIATAQQFGRPVSHCVDCDVIEGPCNCHCPGCARLTKLFAKAIVEIIRERQKK